MILRPRRSALFMPASNPRAVAKARTLACDVVILDLEDAVAPEAKSAARDAAAAAARDAAAAAVGEGGFGKREVVIRANALDTEWGMDDLRAIAAAPPDAVLLPKVSDVATLRAARNLVGDVPLWAMIETARAVLDLSAIVAAATQTGLTLLVAGTNDLATELRCRPGIDRAPLMPALGQIVLAARAHGLAVLDGVSNVIDDETAVERECNQGRAWGFDGKTLIHPSQIAPANRAFSPSHDEIAWARAVEAAFADPASAGRGAIRVDGAMVELLHLEEARRTLALGGNLG